MATYYVDATGGNDSNDGLSGGAAWQTIGKVNGAALAAGDSILFKRGETWSGVKLNVPASGTASARITFGSYGTGNKPIITGGGAIVDTVSTNSKTFLKFEDMAFTGSTQSNFAAGTGNIICERCDNYDSLDQNFQLVGTVRALLIDCTSTGAADDGVSMHDTAFVHIKGGSYSENSQGINAASGTGLIRLIAEDAEFLDNTSDAINMPANAVCDVRRCLIRTGPSSAKGFVGDGRITDTVFDGSLGGLTHTLIQSNAGVLELEHCTFWGNGKGQIVPWNNTQVYIRNCIFDDIYRFTANQAGSVTIAENNIVYSAVVYGVTGTATGTITSDPLLVDPANGNWSVTSGSPALNGVVAGTDAAGNAIRTTIGAWQETATYANASDVRFGVDRGDGTDGTCYVPTANNVLSGVNVDATTGTVVLPDAVSVLDSVSYGAASGTTGTYHAPEASEVVTGASFGPASSIDGTAPDYSELLSAIAAIGVGDGDYRLTIPVQDADENAIAGARVSVPGTTLVATTGTSGTVFFNVDADTYTVRVMPPSGYETPDDTDVEVVDDDLTAEPIVLTPWFANPPDDPTLSTLLVKCVDEFGAIEPGVSVDVRLVKIPTGSTNVAFDGKKQTADSNESGLAQFTVVRLATYEYKRGSADVWTRAVIQDADSTSVTSFIGSD